jgi:hypothetical protein
MHIEFLSIPDKSCPLDPGIPSNVYVTHACLIKFKGMLQAGSSWVYWGFAAMIFTLLFG